MNLPIHIDPPPLAEGDDGVVRISGTRVPLERVVRAFQAGATPEQIAQDFDVPPPAFAHGFSPGAPAKQVENAP